MSRCPTTSLPVATALSEINPDSVVGEVGQILNEFANRPVAGRTRKVALDTFASSLGVSQKRRARAPCFSYADSRLREAGDAASPGAAEVQQRTGCRLHGSYLTPRLWWLRDTEPDTFGGVRHWMSLGGYVYLRLRGVTAAGTSTAA